jgi:hypothetical protein
MTNVTIVSQAQADNLLAVTFEIDSGTTYIVDGQPVDEAAYVAAQDKQVERASFRSVVRDVVYMSPPFSQKEFDRLIAPILAGGTGLLPAEFSPPRPLVQGQEQADPAAGAQQ